MAKEYLVDQYLDEWEELLETNPDFSIGRFISERLQGVETEIVEAFRRQAESLALIDQQIRLAVGPLSTMTSSHTSNLDELRLSKLDAGLEPIPGYKLINQIGRGGFGEVWKAASPGGFYVALKFVPIGGRIGDIEERSLEVIRDVRHPHLLSVFGTWRVDDLLIIATELADRTLLDRLKEAQQQGHDGIPKDELLIYLDEAAKGIDFLNDPGKSGRMQIQHRDIKPQNLLLSGGSVKVGDFGLARFVQYDVTGHTGSLTFAYAAPECFDGTTSNRSDQYSLAVTYCHLRSGRLPFDGTQVKIMKGHLKNQPDLSMIPAAERPALTKAMAKRPKDRWPSCREFVLALQKPPIHGGGQPTRDRANSSFAIAGLLLLTVVLAAALTLFLWPPLQNVSKRDKPNESSVSLGVTKDDAEPRQTAISTVTPTRSSISIDNTGVIAEAESIRSRESELKRSIDETFKDYPLSVMSFEPMGEVKALGDDGLTAVVRCELRRDAYRNLISEIGKIAEQHAVLMGDAVFPFESSGTRLDYAKALDEPPLAAMRKILYKDDDYSARHCFLILGKSIAQPSDERESELHSEWFVLPRSFGVPLLEHFRNSVRLTLKCELLDAKSSTIATQIIKPTFYTSRFPDKAANLPFFPVGTAWGINLIDIDYESDSYKDENVLVFLPTLLVPEEPGNRYTTLTLSKNRHFDIPVQFDIESTEQQIVSKLVIEASLPNATK